MCTLCHNIISSIVRKRQKAEDVIFISVIIEIATFNNEEYADIAYTCVYCIECMNSKRQLPHNSTFATI